MNIILLSGGSGKRLWPLSNEVRSKQFLQLLTDEAGEHESMVQRVYRQIRAAGIEDHIVVATSASQKDSIRRQLGKKVDVVVEPERRNTFPAIVLASSYLTSERQVDAEETVIVLPVDPYVDLSYFQTFLKMDEVVQSGRADMVLMGIQPSYPSAKYGYILCKDGADGGHVVTGFKEKPDENVAAELIAGGALWNGGVFAFKLSYLQKITKQYLQEIDFHSVRSHYGDLKKDSFDYEVVEKAQSLAVVTYEGQWKDIGTWNTLTEVMKENSVGDVTMGEECVNTHVINELSIPVVTLGTENIVVAASPDGILVSDKHKSSYIKPHVEKLDSRPMYEESIWGDYKVLDYTQYEDGHRSLIKQMQVSAGKYLDYLSHKHKDVTWTIVDGQGYLIMDGVTTIARGGDVFHFRAGDKHGLKAISDMHLVEVQMGNELSEEDEVIYEWPQ